MKKVAIYIRVSTIEQASEGYSIQAQTDRLTNYCKAKDWLIFDTYIDGGFTGSNIDRPAMQSLISNIKNFDLVLVYKLDRLSRSQKDTLYLIEDVFLKNDVDFVSMNESFDTSTPFGRAMIGILSVFAQLEREQIKERTVMGKKERAKEGLYRGGGLVPIGYDYKDNKLSINENEASQIKEVFRMYLSGIGPTKISQLMNGYTHKYGDWKYSSTVRNVLQNKTYIGKINAYENEYDGQHESIIDIDTFELAQSKLKSNYRESEKTTSLLVGFIYCAFCGARYGARKNSVSKYYMCYSKDRTKPYMIKDKDCKNRTWKADKLELEFEKELHKLWVNKSYLKSLLNKDKPKDNSIALNKKRIDIDKQISKLMDLYQLGNIPIDEISSRIDKLHNEKKILESELNEVRIPIEIDSLYEYVSSFKILWGGFNLEEKRECMKILVKKILVYDDKIEIKWTFM